MLDGSLSNHNPSMFSAAFQLYLLEHVLPAYCVYEVYSWDVMEPATYFLMVSDKVTMPLADRIISRW